MSVRVTGMNSGLDTEAIIQELVSASSTKKTTLEKAQTKLEWKQEAWAALNTKIKSFYNTSLSNLRFSSSFKKKKTTSSNTNIATVVAGDSAVNGSQSLIVKSLARSGYLTGGKLSENKSVKKTTTLQTLNSDIGTGDTASISVKVNGKTTQIDLTGSSTINDVISKLQSAGVNASFDETNQRIFVSVAESGAANDFSLTANNVSGLKALSSLGLLTAEELENNASANSTLAALYDASTGTLAASADAQSYVSKKATGYASALQSSVPSAATIQGYYDKIAALEQDWNDVGSIGYNEAVATYGNKENVKQQQAELAEKKDYLALIEKENALEAGESLSEEDAEKLSEYRDKFGDPDFTEEDLATEEAELNNAVKQFESYESYQAAVAAQEQNIRAAAKNAKILNDYYADAYADQLSAWAGDTYAQKLEEINVAISEAAAQGADTADLEAQQKVLQTMAANEALYTGSVVSADDITYDAATEGIQNRAVSTATQEAEAAYEMVNNAGTYLSATNNAVRVMGQDAVILLNGAEFTSETNSFSINGLTITAKSVSSITGTDANGNPIYEETTINTEDDIDGVYDMIKSFLNTYNELIKEIDTLYGAESAKDYEPLTSDEKYAMTDDEIEKWETKIKDALLRHDSDLGDIRNILKTAMLSSFTINGTKYSLSSFGINTLGYFSSGEFEKGVYHINGDPDDESTSGEADKLKQLIASDPDTVTSFFTQLASNLYETMQKASQTSANRSFGNFYNDKVLANQYSDYKSKISKQEEKIAALEDKYYAMFSAMETAMAKTNSTSSYISSLFGS